MKRKMLLALPALLLSATPFSMAHAEEKFWYCGSGSWTADSCWSNNSQPASGDTVNLIPLASTGGYTVTYDSNSNITLDTLRVGGGSPATVTLKITAPNASIDTATFNVGEGIFVGEVGSGAVVQEGGTVGSLTYTDVNNTLIYGTSLTLGYSSGDSGTYTLTGGSLFADTETIGRTGSGVFTHDGATGSGNTTNDTSILYLGKGAGSHGTYNLGAGELTSNGQYIGYNGTGVFIQSSPLNSYNTTNSLYLGFNLGSTGTYTMMGGWLTAGSEAIGYGGTGEFTQYDGLNSISGDLTIGSYMSSSGEYSMIGVLGGNPTLAVGNNVYVGEYGEGSFTQEGGSITAANEYLGYVSGGVGYFTQNSGSNTVSGGLYLGYSDGSYGEYNLNGSGWSSTLNAGAEVVGHDGDGVFNQSGGWNVVGTNLIVGSGTGTGEYNLSGGDISAYNEDIGAGTGSGVFNQTGGSNQVSGTLTVGANGTYNLNSSITESGAGFAFLSAGTIVNNGVINYSGGYGIITATGGNICTYCGNYDPNATAFENNGTLNISGETAKTINGNITNNGTINAVNTSVTFTGTFTNNGEYFSDPSSSWFNDLIINQTGYLVGGTGDNFFISGDLMNYSDQTALWYTADSYLGFTGTTLHEFYLAGWDSASSMSFSWDTLELSDGGSIFLNGGNGASLYVDNLILSAGSSLDLNGFNIYYYSLTDFGGSFYNGQLINLASNTGGGSEVPEPSTLLLLGSGIAGVAGIRWFYRQPGRT